MDKKEVKLIVSNSPPFNKLSEEQIDELITICEVKEYKNADIIYKEGDPADFLYLLLRGRIIVSVYSGYKSLEIEILKRGTCFGVISLLTEAPHSVTARSIETSFVLQVAKKAFREFLDKNPKLALEFWRILSQRVKARSKPKRIFQSKKIGIMGQVSVGKTTYMFKLAQQLERQATKKIICIQIMPIFQKDIVSFNKATHSDSDDRKIALSNFSEENISGYIQKNTVDSLCIIADSGDKFFSLLNFLSESYHFILYEIPQSFLTQDLKLFIEPAEELHFILFPQKGSLRKVASLMQDLNLKNFLYSERVKIILAEFPFADHLSFEKKRRLLGHPIYATLPSCESSSYTEVLQKIARQIAGVTLGVALGSGAAYGYAHIGVLKILQQAQIPIDLICGSSMGAVIAALWAWGLSIKEIQNYAYECGQKIGSFSFPRFSIPFRGIIRAQHLESIFKRIFKDLTFYDLKHTLKIVTFNFRKRKTVVLEEGLIYKALAASCAFPGIFEPVRLKKDILLDGGILNPLPTKILLQYSVHKIIASNIILSKEQALSQYSKKERLHIFDFIFGSIESMQQHFVEQAIKIADVTIHPNLEGLGWMEFDKINEFIKRGEVAAEEKLNQIKNLIAS